jgi:hypothetical protein
VANSAESFAAGFLTAEADIDAEDHPERDPQKGH